MDNEYAKRRKQPVSLAVIAERAGVSMISVSKALNATGEKTQGVSAETLGRVRRIAAELGYRPNLAARVLRGGKSQMVGAFLDTHAPSTKLSLVAAVERALARHGYRMMVGQFHDSLDRVRDYINDFSMRGVDGVISFGHDYNDPNLAVEVPKAVARMDNAVFVGRAKLDQPYHCVTFDYTGALALAYDHLLQRGRKRIGMITIQTNAISPNEKVEGYRQARRSHGHAEEPDLIGVVPIESSLSVDVVRETVLRVVQQGRADGLFIHSDLCARVVLRALDGTGYVVPDDVAVVSMDNDLDSQFARPSLTTVGFDLEQFASQIVKRTLAQIHSDDREESPPPTMQLIDAQLFVRESSG